MGYNRRVRCNPPFKQLVRSLGKIGVLVPKMEPIIVGNNLLWLQDNDDPMWFMVADILGQKRVICRARHGEWGEVDLSSVDRYCGEQVAKWLIGIGEAALYAINVAQPANEFSNDDWPKAWVEHNRLERDLDSFLSDVHDEDDKERIEGKELVARLVSGCLEELLPILLSRLIVSKQLACDDIASIEIDLTLI